jgi:hypothetical protein
MVDQNAAHALGRKGEDVRPIRERQPVAVNQPTSQFVDQRIGFQGVVGEYVSQMAGCDLLEFGMDRVDELGHCCGVAMPPVGKPAGHLV